MEMAHDNSPRLKAGHLLYPVAKDKTYPSQTYWVGALFDYPLYHDIPAFWPGAFSNYYNAEAFALLVALADLFGDYFNIIRYLRNENYVPAASYSGMECEPSRPVAHHLYDHYAMMRLRVCMYPVYPLRGYPHSGVKTESDVSPHDIVVYGLWDSDDRYAVFE